MIFLNTLEKQTSREKQVPTLSQKAKVRSKLKESPFLTNTTEYSGQVIRENMDLGGGNMQCCAINLTTRTLNERRESTRGGEGEQRLDDRQAL